MNIVTNFVPNEIKTNVPRDPPWIPKHVNTMLNRTNKLFKHYKRHGYKPEDKVRLHSFRKESQEAVKVAKSNYLTNMGNKLNNPNTSQNCNWKIIYKVMNKCKVVNNLIMLNCREKAKLFTDFFSQQCKPVFNHSVLPDFNYLTNEKTEQIPIENEN